MEEIELKFLEVNILELEEKLIEVGAKKVGEYFYKRSLFDYPDFRLRESGKMLRVRNEGNQVTVTLKGITGFTTHENVTKDAIVMEDEIVVSDFKTACEIFLSIGLIEDSYQENKRIRYTLNNVEIDIDSWPKIPPYAEIEGKSLEAVEDVARILGFKIEDAVRYPTTTIYKRHYGINFSEYSRITFTDWVKK